MKVVLILVLVSVIGAQARRVIRDAPAPDDVFAFNTFMDERQIAALSTRCKNVSGSDDAFNNIEPAFNNFYKCVDTIFDIKSTHDKLKENLNAPDSSSKEETIEEVLKEICPLTTGLMQCIDVAFTTGIRPCLLSNEYEVLDEMVRTAGVMFDYVCYNDGERVVQLINDGAEACFTEHQEELSECATNATKNKPLKWSLKYSKNDCDTYDEIQSCIVTGLHKCEKQTISGTIKGFFDAIKKETKCSTFETGNEI